jgi:hypothetical protein
VGSEGKNLFEDDFAYAHTRHDTALAHWRSGSDMSTGAVGGPRLNPSAYPLVLRAPVSPSESPQHACAHSYEYAHWCGLSQDAHWRRLSLGVVAPSLVPRLNGGAPAFTPGGSALNPTAPAFTPVFDAATPVSNLTAGLSALPLRLCTPLHLPTTPPHPP